MADPTKGPARTNDAGQRVNRWTGRPCGARGCAHLAKSTGELCGMQAYVGTDGCRRHSGKSATKAKAEGLVRAEFTSWGLTDQTVDPGVVLLRLVTQSAARCQLYARLLEEAYDAAERLRAGHEAGALIEVDDAYPDDADDDADERPAVAAAREDLRRIFATGGVAALVGQTYSASASGSVYAAGEAIRGLAKLEAEERDRCAGFAAKAVAAGLAERQVRLAEQQGALMVNVIRAVLEDLGVAGDPRIAEIVPRRLREITAGAA